MLGGAFASKFMLYWGYTPDPREVVAEPTQLIHASIYMLTFISLGVVRGQGPLTLPREPWQAQPP